jgi:LmbE family N-acetylglucosaminyl deacetylase
VVPLAVAQLAEAAQRVFPLRVVAGEAGEDLGDEERLAKEALDLAGAATMSLSSSLSSSTPRIAMMSCRLAVALEDLLHRRAIGVVLLADDAGSRNRGSTSQRVDRG